MAVNQFPWGVSIGLLIVALGCIAFMVYILRMASLGK